MIFSKIIKKKFDAVLGRYNGDPAQYYFSPADFSDIKSENFDIKGDNDVLLKGYFYYYNEFNADKFIVFDHGIGAGHLAYFNEIEYLAKNGYTVYSYDHTGCAESEGTGILGFAQGVNDLDHVISALKKDERLKGKNIKLMGHSWGGYSSMNVAQFHPEITHIVSVSGFLSARSLIEQYLPKFVMKYSDEVMDRERQHNPKYADLDARESLLKTKANFLFIQSTDDTKVKYELSYEPLYNALKGRENTEFISVNNRNHDPHLTDAAVKATNEMAEKERQLLKKKKLSTKEQQEEFKKSQNWKAINEQDTEIWDKILAFLDK